MKSMSAVLAVLWLGLGGTQAQDKPRSNTALHVAYESLVGRWKVTVFADGGPYRGYLTVSSRTGPNIYRGMMTLNWGGSRHGLTGRYSISGVVQGTSVRMNSTNVSFAPPDYDGWFSPTTYTLTAAGQTMTGIVLDHNQCDGQQKLTVCRVSMIRD